MTERMRKLGFTLLYVVVLPIGAGMYARHEYHRGFDNGADTAICAFAISIEGAKPAMTYDACKNITDHDYEIEGFDNGFTAGAAK